MQLLSAVVAIRLCATPEFASPGVVAFTPAAPTDMVAGMLNKRPTFSFKDQSPNERLGELMLYVAGRCADDPKFGATKLNKILYFSDFMSYKRTGKAITGAEYVKQKNGPIPKQLLPVRKKLEAKKHAAIQTKSTLQGYAQQRLIPLREPDLTFFSAEEIVLVDKVIKALESHTASQVSDLSHGRVWRIAAMDEPIPYESVFVSDENPSAEDVKRAQVLIKKYNWAV